MRKKLLIGFVLLLILLFGALTWLVASQSGLNTAVSLAQKVVPALTVEKAKGRLITGINLTGLRYRPEAATGVEVDKLDLQWQASALLHASLYIKSLDISDVTIYSVASQQEADTELSPPEITLPLQVEIAKAEISDVDMIDEKGHETQLVKHFQTTAKADYKQLNISEFALSTDEFDASLSGQIELAPPYQSQLKYQLTAKQLLPSELDLNGELAGNIEKLEITQTLSEPLASTQTVTVTDLLENLHWSLLAKSEHIDLAAVLPEQQTQFDALTIKGEGSLTALTASVQSRVTQPELPSMVLNADVSSEDLKNWLLDVNAAVSDKQQLALTGSVDISGDQPLADLKVSWQNLSWPVEGEAVMVASPEGILTLKGTLDEFQTELNSVLHWQQEQIHLVADSHGSSEQLYVDKLTVDAFQGQLTANGKLDWHSTPLQYQLDGNWHGMTLPQSLTGQKITLKQGAISVAGDNTQLSLTTQTDLKVDEQAASISAEASGQTETGFEQADLTVKLADGSLRYQGPVLWAGDSLLDGKVSLSQLNPGILAPEWPGQLSGHSDIKLDNSADGIKAQANDIAISGELRQRPVKLSGDVSYSAKLIDVSALKLVSGKSTLTASGQLLEDTADFNWAIQSPDLQDFYPKLGGELKASGDIKGSLKAPAINADLQAANLQFEAIKAGKIDGKAKIVLSDNADLNADIAISDLSVPELEAQTLQLSIKGQRNHHQIDLALASKALSVEMQAEGGLDAKQQWQGQFNTFSFSNDKAWQWQLSEKGELTLAASQQNIPQHCWSSSNGAFCLQANHDGKTWQTAGHFKQLPLSLFEGFVVQLEQMQGTLRGDFELAADKSSVITGAGEVFLDDAKLQLNQTALNQQKPLALNNVALKYQLDTDKTTASFHLEPQLDGVSAVNAELETAGLKTLTSQPEQAALRGSVTTAVKDLAALELAHPAFTDLQGQLDIDLSLAGTVAQPEIDGTASLKQGQVAIVDAGIVLKQIEANVKGDLEQVDFDLQAKSGKGTLNGNGQFKLTDKSWQLTTALEGEQLEMMNTPEALVIAEPDLTITVTPEKTLVKGKVDIPKAEIEPREFNSTVSPSKDVVVVSDEQQDASAGPVTELDVTVSLGDKVKLKAMGFQGRLTGGLRVTGKTSDVLLGNGEIKIKDGSYIAYGQLLHVDDGSIRFAGPVDNPELDLKAVRKGKDYKAGLHIEGYASSPQATLFSDPDMTQDNILSYILLGKPVDQASATDAALLASAATGMGLQNGAMIGDQIASTFGLDEFSVQGDSAENAALQVGKYLSPKLYLSYGIGVFDSVSTVELRYQLSKIWALKAESGTESGVDLLYTYERGGPKSK